MLRRFAAWACAVSVLAAAGCANTDHWVDAAPSLGWSAPYGDAANSSYTDRAGAEQLTAAWTRSVKGTLGAAVALGTDNYLALNAQTDDGCSLMVWEIDNNARQRWCTRLWPGGGFAGPLMDGFDNLYIGQPGAIVSFPPTQWIRWRQPVIGMPQTPRLLAGGQLLVITHLGQVLVFNAHRGTVEGTPLDLVTGLDPTDSERGLADCAPARAECPVAAAPAFSPKSNAIVLGIWQPGARAATLVGLRYKPGESPLISQEWTSDAVGAGVIAAPVLSADGRTVYVNGRDRRLWALDAADGTVKWSAPLKFLAQTPPTVAPDGTIISGGGPRTQLVALRDEGDHATELWRRKDITPLTTSSRSGTDIAYTVIGDDAEQVLLAFDPRDGETVNEYPLPGAEGFPVGVSLARDHSVVAATSAGQVYGFRAD